jgi:hypothetical protein
MKTFSITTLLFLGINLLPQAQTKAADSVVINVGSGSKITVVIKDKKDLETLKSYNFQSLMNDLIANIESKDTVSGMKPNQAYLNESQPTTQTTETKQDSEENWKRTYSDTESLKSNSGSSSDDQEKSRRRYRGTRQSVSFDIGTNNYLTSGGKFPDPGTDLHTVRPWGSWYVAINSVHRSRLSRTFFVEWGLGLSQYNFKFQNDDVQVVKTSTAPYLEFRPDDRASLEDIDFKKSKLSAIFLNASFVPVIDFGGNYKKPVMFDGRRSDSFRIGFGPYAGYRIDSYTRQVFEDDGNKKKDKDRDNYYLNNVRYGLRLQLGLKDTDLFFNYDLNELFMSGKGPQLNAFSFGVSF